MARTLVSVIRKAPAPDGPFHVRSYDTAAADGADFNITTGVASLGAALDQAKTDQASLIGASTFIQAQITVQATDL